MLKATACGRALQFGDASARGRAVLDHGQRHLRRCRLELEDGAKLLVDLPETVVLDAGDVLLLEDGGHIEIVAAPEALYEVTGRDAAHLVQLAWHIGNRHLAAEISEGRIRILRDHVIKSMLQGLGAQVSDIVAPFSPVRGAYAGHGAHHHDGDQGASRGEPVFQAFRHTLDARHGH